MPRSFLGWFRITTPPKHDLVAVRALRACSKQRCHCLCLRQKDCEPE